MTVKKEKKIQRNKKNLTDSISILESEQNTQNQGFDEILMILGHRWDNTFKE